MLLTKVIRDRSGDDERNDPPDWYDHAIQDLSLFRNQRRSVEYLHQDVVVEYFDADVAVQTRSDQCRDQCDCVPCSLPAVNRNTLIARRVTTKQRQSLAYEPQDCRLNRADEWFQGNNFERRIMHNGLPILALIIINEAPVNHVDGVNEELSSPHGFQEIMRTFHLGQEFHVQLCSCVSQNSCEKAIDGAD